MSQDDTDEKSPAPAVSHWRRLSDEALLDASFTHENPEFIEGLVLDVPDNGVGAFVEFAYNFRGSDRPYIRCAHCRYPNHLAGYVMKTDDWRRYLVGHDCGEKIYGAHFEEITKDFDEARDRASSLHRIRNIRAVLPPLLGWLSTISKNAAFWQFHQTRTELKRDMPRLFSALAGAVEHHDGALFVDEKVRDHDAETRDDDRYEREMEAWNKETVTERKRRRGSEPKKPIVPRFKTVPRQVGLVRTSAFVSTGPSPVKPILEAIDGFTAIAESMRGSARWTNSEMTSWSKRTTEYLDQVERAIIQLAELAVFFQPGNLRQIADWATRRAFDGTYEAGLTSIRFNDTRSRRTSFDVAAPVGFRPPSHAPLARFRAEIDRPR